MKRIPLLVLSVLMVAGCGSAGPQLGTVHGKVTLDGHLLDKGVIRFDPGQGVAPACSLDIKAGEYQGSAYPGNSRVYVSALKVKGKRKLYASEDSPTVDEFEESIPSQYNATSMLSFEVKPGRNEFDVDMVSQLPKKSK